MGKLNFNESKFSKFLNGKGFYAALAVCLVGAGLATWAAVNSTLSGLNVTDAPEDTSSFTASGEDWGFQDTPAGVDQKDQPIGQGDLTPPESLEGLKDSSEPSSSSQSASEPSKESSGTEDSQEVLTQPEQSAVLYYVSPISGEIFNDYSHGELVKSKTMNDWRTHDGIDISAALGTPVQAVADGNVIDISTDSMWGTVITIEHPDGIQSIYACLNEATTVAVGDAVTGGDIIGTVGAVPEAEVALESHLHFAVMQDGEYLDPVEVVDELQRIE